MDDLPLPYFFPEAMRVAKRLSERERQRGITERDRDFLRNLFFANASGRKAQSPVMIAERLLLSADTENPMELAGAFMMSSEGSYTPAFFYGPETGLEKFDSSEQLLSEIAGRLRDPEKRTALLNYLSIDQRAHVHFDQHASLRRELIEGNVFDEQQAAIEHYQGLNVQAMRDELCKLPSMKTLLDQLLAATFRTSFPGLDQRKTRAFFYAPGPSPSDSEHLADSRPLGDALLQFYRQQSWPVGLRRDFLNPALAMAAQGSSDRTRHQALWETGVKDAARQLLTFIRNALEAYWNTDMRPEQSRRVFFAQAMSDKCRVDLLFKRQQDTLSAQQWQPLSALYLPVQPQHSLRIEKARLWEYYPHYVELASTLIIGNNHDTYLYTQSKGLQVLKDYDDLQATLKSMAQAAGHEDDFYNFLALDERARFIGFKHPQFSPVDIHSPVFKTLLESIIDKQQQNLVYALDIYRRSQGTINVYALFDHGLDIRAMIDQRLLALDVKGRWSTLVESPKVPVEKARLLIQQLRSIDLALQRDLTPATRLGTLIVDQLKTRLSARNIGHLNPETLYINRYTSKANNEERRVPVSTQRLSAHCMARMLGEAQAIPESLEYGVYGPRTRGQATRIAQISIAQLNSLVDQSLISLTPEAIGQTLRTHLETLNPKLVHAMSSGVLEESRLRLLDKTLKASDIAILNTVLDPDRTDRDSRESLNGFTPDAFMLSLITAGESTLMRLANCFLLTERGGLDFNHSGRALLWTPAHGLEPFASISLVRDELDKRLRHPAQRLSLLENLNIRERKHHQDYRLGPFQLIQGPVLQKCQQSWAEQYVGQRSRILARKTNARSLWDAQVSGPENNVQRAINLARLSEVRLSLPDGLGAAPPREQRRQAEFLEQYRLATESGRDYLDGFYPLQERVRDRLNEQLVDYSLFAGDVEIALKLALEDQHLGLLDFAMSPASLQETSFNVVSSAPGLTEAVIRQMLSQLKIGDDYHTYVNERLTPGKPGVEQRLHDFSRQLPWQLLQHAHALKLQERLSAQGFDLIQQALDMPDAIARASVAGATARVRPFELIATPGASVVNALGLYLISSGREGPQILYAPYHQELSFTEFASETDLLAQLNRPSALQEWVLKRLPAPQDATYRNLLHATLGATSEITLGFNPIQGNLFEQLFNDNRLLLLQLLGRQSLPDAETEWETVKQVFSDNIVRLMNFLPGKLALPWIIWRSIQLFMASAQALQDHHWRKALRAFIEGVAEMALIGEALQKTEKFISSLTAEPPVADLPQSASWSALDITAPERTLLQPSEVNDVALVDMTLGATPGVYQHKGHRYIPLAGKVYPVQSMGDFWRITSDKQTGPFVCRNTAGQWVIDTRKHIARYGQAFGRLQDRSAARHSARQALNIEAVGMRAIRRFYPDRARMIVDALDLATLYLQNCKLNLALLEPEIAPVTRIHRFVQQFFGIEINPDRGPRELDPALVQKLHRLVDGILAAILDPTLYSLESMRFVTGAQRAEERSWAFTIDNDPERRIYLSENFFTPPLGEYENRLITYFDRDTHARAAVLIHELSHLTHTTTDAAYVNAIMPFSDLIETLTQEGRDLRKFQQDRQTQGYSLLTPIDQLFKFPDITGTLWSDFGTTAKTQYIKAQILKTTGGVDLKNARSIFMTNLAKRVDTILDNADSVAYLITQLGRQLDPRPASRPPTP